MLESGNSCNLEKSLQHFKQNICTKFEQILFVMMNSSCPIETAMNCFSIHFRLFHWRIRFAISSDQKAPPSLEAGCPARLRSGQSFVCCSHVLEMPSCINFARCGCGQLLQSMASNRKDSCIKCQSFGKNATQKALTSCVVKLTKGRTDGRWSK